MIQITPQMRILVAVEPADSRKGIDGLPRLWQERLQQDPFSGWVFAFRHREATAATAPTPTTAPRRSGCPTNLFNQATPAPTVRMAHFMRRTGLAC